MSAVNFDTVISIGWSSLNATLHIVGVSIAGVLCARFPKDKPLLPVTALQFIARVSNTVFLPSLVIYSIGAALSKELLSRLGILIIAAIIINLISSFIVEFVVKYIYKGDDPILMQTICVAVMSPNAVSLPLMVMQSLCEQKLINSHYNNDYGKCYAEASLQIFIYSVGWQILFWSFSHTKLVALPLLIQKRDEEIHLKDDDKINNIEKPININNKIDFYGQLQNFKVWFLKVFIYSPVMMSIFIGMVIGVSPTLQYSLFVENAGPFRFIGSTILTLSTPVVCINCLVTSASLAHVNIDIGIFDYFINLYNKIGLIFNKFKYNKVIVDSSFDKNEDNLQEIKNKINIEDGNTKDSLEIGNSNSLVYDNRERSNSVISDSSGRVRTDSYCLADSDATIIIEKEKLKIDNNKLPSKGSIITFCVCRLVLPPLVIIPLLKFIVDKNIISKHEPLIALLLCIESASSSAQMIIVVLSQLGVPEIASKMAYMYVYQYFTSIITLTLSTTMGMILFFL
jgi:hypothetical protein